MYVGTYTDKGTADGVHLVRMNASTGALSRVAAFDAGPNPSFLALHPDGRTLYAVNELEEMNGQKTGSVRAFTIAPDTHALTQLGEELTGGGAPCYVSTDVTGNVLLVANYVGGSVERDSPAVSAPAAAFQWKDDTVDSSSLDTNSSGSRGWNARCLGPAPGRNSASPPCTCASDPCTASSR